VLAPAVAHAVTFSGPTSFPAGDYATSVAVGDFNGDSRSDLATANVNSDDVSILLGEGSGGFGPKIDIAVGDFPNWIVVGDFNGDSRPDLAVANFNSGNISILLGDGSGGFSGPTDFAVDAFPCAVAIGNINGDSSPDLVTANVSSDNVSVLLGDGSGGFGAPAQFSVGNNPCAVAAADFNGDSRTDLAAANVSSDNVSILLGDGSGGFSGPVAFAAGDSPISIAVGYFNGDSLSDLAVANRDSDNASILLGDGSGGFSTPTNFTVGDEPYSVAVADFDADSRADLAVVNTRSDGVSVLLGDGSGRFGGAVGFGIGGSHFRLSVAVGNFNGDSRPDMVTANAGTDSVSIFLNTTPPPIGYPRPKGASPLRVSLVPAYQECTAPNGTHGEPLADPSCTPALASAQLTLGSPDANGEPLNAAGFVRYTVVAGTPGGVDDSDVNFDFSINDVRNEGGTYPDYTGELQAITTARITDRLNGPSANAWATVTDIPIAVTAPCVATAGPDDLGATCGIATSLDAVVPGTIPERKRSVWELGRVEVHDGGTDGDADTEGDNALFMTQGLFVP
jgi:hypothetical protein